MPHHVKIHRGSRLLLEGMLKIGKDSAAAIILGVGASWTCLCLADTLFCQKTIPEPLKVLPEGPRTQMIGFQGPNINTIKIFGP